MKVNKARTSEWRQTPRRQSPRRRLHSEQSASASDELQLGQERRAAGPEREDSAR